jgi:hypothetical protein
VNAMSDVVSVAAIAIVLRSLRAYVLAACTCGKADGSQWMASGNPCQVWRNGFAGNADGRVPSDTEDARPCRNADRLTARRYFTIATKARHALTGTLSA